MSFNLGGLVTPLIAQTQQVAAPASKPGGNPVGFQAPAGNATGGMTLTPSAAPSGLSAQPTSMLSPSSFGLDAGGVDPNQRIPGFAMGGVVPGNGAPQPSMGGAPGMQLGASAPAAAPIPAQMIDAHIQQMMQQHPDVVQKVQQSIQQAMQSGQLTSQQLQLAVQLATACAQNPALWPQMRQFAISKGLAGPDDLPQQYDEGLVISILIAGRALSAQPQQGNVQPGMATGGLINGPGTGTSDSVPAINTTTASPLRVSAGEFVVPERVVRAKGTDFFHKLISSHDETHDQHLTPVEKQQ